MANKVAETKTAELKTAAFRQAADICDEHAYRLGAATGMHKVAALIREGKPVPQAISEVHTKLSKQRVEKLAKTIIDEVLRRRKEAGCGSKGKKMKKKPAKK